MDRMTEAAKQRMEQYVRTHYPSTWPNGAEKYRPHEQAIATLAYQAGMQDPDAGKHECDDTCQRDMNIECPISYPKVLVSKELLDEALKFVVCGESCNSSKGRGFRKCDCGAQALQEKIREVRK